MSPDRVLAIVVEYEAAAMDAVQALDGNDRRQQLVTCLPWADAVRALNTLSDTDGSRVGELPLQRGNVLHHAWPRILAALEEFEVERQARDRGK